MRGRLLAIASLAAVVVSASLASGATARSSATRSLTIYAAASLTDVFKTLDPAQHYSFGGSNALETQIRNGAPADVFASAAPLSTQRLFKAGIVDPAKVVKTALLNAASISGLMLTTHVLVTRTDEVGGGEKAKVEGSVR